MRSDLTQRFEDALRAGELLPAPGRTALVAVSGGLDSTCLARLLADCCAEENLDLVLAHVQHGLRPSDAAVELRAVVRLATSLYLVLRVGRVEIAEELRAEVGLEAAARQARLGWLEQSATELGAQEQR